MTQLQSLKEEIRAEMFYQWAVPARVISDEEAKKQTGFDASVWVWKGDVEKLIDAVVDRVSAEATRAERERVLGVIEGMKKHTLQNVEVPKNDVLLNFGYNSALSDLSSSIKDSHE